LDHGAVAFHGSAALKKLDFHKKPQLFAAPNNLSLETLQRSARDFDPIPRLKPFFRSKRLASYHEAMDPRQILMQPPLILHPNAMSHLIGGQGADPRALVSQQKNVARKKGRSGGQQSPPIPPTFLGEREKKRQPPTQEMAGQRFFRPRPRV